MPRRKPVSGFAKFMKANPATPRTSLEKPKDFAYAESDPKRYLTRAARNGDWEVLDRNTGLLAASQLESSLEAFEWVRAKIRP